MKNHTDNLDLDMSKRPNDSGESNKDLLLKKVRLAYQSVHNKTQEENNYQPSAPSAAAENNTNMYKHKIQSNDATTLGLSDVLQLEHSANNLQNSLKTILEMALDNQRLAEFKQRSQADPSAVSPEVLVALQRSKLSLAAHLKTLYNEDQLPIFDQIIDYEELAKHNIANDRVELDLGQATQKLHSMEDEPVERMPDGTPVLPEIENPAIRARVFIHKSLVKDKLFISGSEVIHAHNERLEFIGDSVLNNIMSMVIYNACPNATEGEMSQLRAKLISNATLQRWANIYGFENELKMNTDDSIYKGKLKIYADVFEAYVGGLITENPMNYTKIYRWLRALAEPIIKGEKAHDSTSNTTPSSKERELNTQAKVELYSLIGFAGLGLHYDVVHRDVNRDITKFTVQVKTKEGEVLGTGVGKNTKEAGYRAAMDALDNKPLIERFARYRASIPREESKVTLNAYPRNTAKNTGSNTANTSDDPWVRDADGKWVKTSALNNRSGSEPPKKAPARQEIDRYVPQRVTSGSSSVGDPRKTFESHSPAPTRPTLAASPSSASNTPPSATANLASSTRDPRSRDPRRPRSPSAVETAAVLPPPPPPSSSSATDAHNGSSAPTTAPSSSGDLMDSIRPKEEDLFADKLPQKSEKTSSNQPLTLEIKKQEQEQQQPPRTLESRIQANNDSSRRGGYNSGSGFHDSRGSNWRDRDRGSERSGYIREADHYEPARRGNVKPARSGHLSGRGGYRGGRYNGDRF